MIKKSSFDFLNLEDGFLGDPQEFLESPDQAKAVVVPFGLEKSVSYGGGTSKGPAAIIESSKQVELFDEEFWCETFREFGVATLKDFAIEENIENALSQLEGVARNILDQGKFPLILGGEHSITAGSIRPFVEKYPDLAILHFDAHADLRDGYDGEHYSHAAALRRVMDNPISTLVSVGIRNISASEIPYLDDNKDRIKMYFAKDKGGWNIEEMVAPLKGRPVFVTFDVDGFDASLMQATGTPEPGGLMWNETMDILRAASKVSNIVGADVVELAPMRGFHACDFLTAKLCYKILSYALARSL